MKKKIFAVATIIALTGCAAPTGTVTVHTVDKEKNLHSPLIESGKLNTDPKTIFKSNEHENTNNDDVFAIYLTDSYLRYLKDFGGINEVLIVVEFTEAVTGTTEDTITKILGPYNNIADATRAPLLNKALYGPKKMQSDLLSMNIKVFEYDLEENDNNAALLEFIAGSASALALADPVTQGEIKVVKEIAQTLIRTNENDLVINMDLDFVAGSKKYHAYTESKILPLRDSELVIVKQESCRIGTCYDYFSNPGNSGNTNVPGLLTDALMVIPTTIVKATTDVPDPKSLNPFEKGDVKVGMDGLINKSTNLNFTDKTWLRLSIVKGGDPSLWKARKALYPTEQEINKLLRNPSALTLDNMRKFTERLEEAQQAITNAKASVTLSSTTSNRGTHFILNGASSSALCFNHSDSI